MALHVGAHELRALNSEEDSDTDLPAARDLATARSGRRGRWPVILAGVLSLAALAALAPQSGERQMREPQAQPRLLESDELLDTVLEHALRFHETSGETYDASRENDLKRAARDRVHDLLHEVESRSPEVGRLLSELRLTREQWDQSKWILNALHDKRVQHVGEVIREAATPEEASAWLGAREDELRKLRDELIPQAVRGVAAIPAGQNHWGFATRNGALHAEGPVARWHGAVTVGSETTRRLKALPPGVAIGDGMDKGQLIYLIITATIATLLGIVGTVLTLTLGPAAASILFIVTAGLDGVLCGASLGFMHLPHFKNVVTWVPCMILSSFTGVEAIWTFRKGGTFAGAPALAAATSTTAAPASP